MIEAYNLSKSFGNLHAVIDADIKLAQKDIMGLLGPDAAGKTTLIRMLCGLISPDKGELKVLGYEQNKIEIAKRQMGYMPQRFSLYGDLSVMENISFFGSMYELDLKTIEQRANEILDLTGISTFKNRLAEKLSGGMKQKLALTCALINRPRLLLLDEPTYGVDPESRKEFWKILYQLNREGMSILLSTPYMDEAELCNKVSIMNQGKIILSGSPLEIKENFPCQVWELKILSRDPNFFSDFTSDGLLSVSFYGDRYRLLLEDEKALPDSILNYIQSKGLEKPSYFQKINPSMEDVFIFYE